MDANVLAPAPRHVASLNNPVLQGGGGLHQMEGSHDLPVLNGMIQAVGRRYPGGWVASWFNGLPHTIYHPRPALREW